MTETGITVEDVLAASHGTLRREGQNWRLEIGPNTWDYPTVQQTAREAALWALEELAKRWDRQDST